MKLYYTLTCVILPAAMMAACSGSGSKKLIDNSNIASNAPITKQVEQLINNKPIAPLTEKIEAATLVTNVTAEAEQFPLAQAEYANDNSKPVKRIYQFGFNKQEMDQSEKLSLQEHADYLIAHPDATLDVNGHSDTQGNQAYNQFLSKERAKKVARFLVEYGVPEGQVKANGLGDSQPLNDVNSFKENRRVELEYSDSRIAVK